MRHLISLDDVTAEEVHALFRRVDELLAARGSGRVLDPLRGKTLAMIFEKPSTRTRISFHVAMRELGGDPLFLRQDEIQIGRGESLADTARVLSRFVDGVMIRTFRQSDVEALAKHGTIPVINGLTDLEHPCQVLTDLYTIRQKLPEWTKVKISYVGDGNNVANSWLLAAGKLGLRLSLATPREYPPDAGVVRRARALAAESGARLDLGDDPREAVRGARVVYTDTWVSMGAEKERQERLPRFRGFQVNRELLAGADPRAIVMHCLPAHRGEEITDEVMDGPQSVVFDQAENRLHVQKGILVELMGNEKRDE
ncbi:MAG: ornithine carbamoyltransferase [Candidatus Tectomicrobia bacterium]|nr:ornithine carbamoyltransferase [Candidatus Tectomicrobia bacterium]